MIPTKLFPGRTAIYHIVVPSMRRLSNQDDTMAFCGALSEANGSGIRKALNKILWSFILSASLASECIRCGMEAGPERPIAPFRHTSFITSPLGPAQVDIRGRLVEAQNGLRTATRKARCFEQQAATFPVATSALHMLLFRDDAKFKTAIILFVAVS